MTEKSEDEIEIEKSNKSYEQKLDGLSDAAFMLVGLWMIVRIVEFCIVLGFQATVLAALFGLFVYILLNCFGELWITFFTNKRTLEKDIQRIVKKEYGCPSDVDIVDGQIEITLYRTPEELNEEKKEHSNEN